MGIHTAIETSGDGSWSFFKDANIMGTLFLFDLKAIDPEKHMILTGNDNSVILRNLTELFKASADIIFRLPMIAGLNDDPADIESICGFLCEHSGQYKYAEIMPYHNLGLNKYRLLDMQIPSNIMHTNKDHEDKWVQMFSVYGCKVHVSH
jgi:pyruvate formate lyase activating enzyme